MEEISEESAATALAGNRRRMQWMLSLGLWTSYALLLLAVVVSGAMGAWIEKADWKEGPPLLLFVGFPSALVLVTFELWMGPLRRRRAS